MKQAHVFISGIVQGVGFRQFVKNKARKLGVMGWVRNVEDGGVEAIFQGQDESVASLLALCKQGPYLSEVKQFGVVWEEAMEHYTEFVISSAHLQ